MIVLSHPTGNPPVRNALQALFEARMLTCFCTSLAFSQNSKINDFPIPEFVKRELSRRTYNLPGNYIRSKPTLEILRLLGQRVLGNRFGSGPIDQVCQTIDKLTAKTLHQTHPKGVYAYEDGALESFYTGGQLNIHRFYELPIIYWKELHRILKEQIEKYPAWEKTMEFTGDSNLKCSRKDKELELADTIICPSIFVKESIPKNLRAKCELIPYGAPPPRRESTTPNSNRPLRILFAGSMTQRKGLADLLQAVKILKTKKLELIIMGKLRAPIEFYKEQFQDFVYEPPRKHDCVLELMRSCDAFCLPSIIEGRALVQLEALSCGLPLIITPNTGGSDLIDEGITGFIVPTNAPEHIAEKIDWLASNRSILKNMREAAWDKAEQNSWQHYRSTFIKTIKEKTGQV